MLGRLETCIFFSEHFFFISAILKFFFVVFNVPRALCPVQHDYELLFLDLFLLVWDGWWRQHTFSVQLWTRTTSHVCGRQRCLHPDPSAAVNMFHHMARKTKIADVIQFFFLSADLKMGRLYSESARQDQDNRKEC